MLPEGSSPRDEFGMGPTGFEGAAETTGRWVITFVDDLAATAYVETLRSAGLSNVASSLDFEAQAVDIAATEASDAVVFTELGVAVVPGDFSQVSAMQASAGGRMVSVEPEYVHYMLEGPRSNEYVTGYRDGVADLSARLIWPGSQAP